MAQPQKRQDSFHHGDGFPTTLITATITTPTYHRAQQTSPPYNPNPTNQANENDNDNWNGTKIVASIIPIGFIALLIMSIWYFCCGGREKRQQRRAARGLPGPHAAINSPQHPQSHPGFQTRGVELTPVPAAHLVDGDLPPPRYEEAVPPRHQTVAGGITHTRLEEEGVISDGKTPLSEIPFEDVVVSSASSSGSGSGSTARDFGPTHRGGGGNTHGHTNS